MTRTDRSSRDEQDALWEQYRAHPTDDLRDRLVEANMGLVGMCIGSLAALSYKCGMEPDDLRTPGYLALRRAVGQYDDSNGAMFSTYAVYCIRGSILDYIRDHRRNRVLRHREAWERNRSEQIVCESYDQRIHGEEVDWDAIDDEVLIGEAIDKLPDHEAYVIREVFFNGEPQTALAGALGVSRQTVTNYKHKAFERLAELLGNAYLENL